MLHNVEGDDAIQPPNAADLLPPPGGAEQEAPPPPANVLRPANALGLQQLPQLPVIKLSDFLSSKPFTALLALLLGVLSLQLLSHQISFEYLEHSPQATFTVVVSLAPLIGS